MSSFNERIKLFNSLYSTRTRSLITLITSSKKPEPLFATQIAQDMLSIFYDLLRQGKDWHSVDLLIHSAGGQIDTPWPLINLIREYTTDLRALVPMRAQSAATLVCLGADTIEMSPLASLSPIDPQFQRRLGDKDVVDAGVEDVYGFYSLLEHTLNLDSNGKSEALKLLASRVTPELLGKMSRSRREIRIIATNLLELHIKDKAKVQKIVDALVEELPSHQYMINRKEAHKLGLPISNMDQKTEDICYDILKSYITETRMDEPGIQIDFGAETAKTITMSRAFIETKDRSFSFVTDYNFYRDGKVEKRSDKWTEVTQR